MSSADVLVIGAGVAGLTTAVCLADAGACVRVVAKERPQHTTSAAAGAVWAPYRIGGDPARLYRWSQRSLAVFTTLARSEGAGVRLITSMEVSGRPVAAPEWAPLVAGVRAATPDELPAGYAYGYRFVIPAIDMPTYLAFLLARLENAGGVLEQDTVASLDQVRGTAAAVVNCTGLGARELVGDRALRPVRGQLVVVANPGAEVGLVEAEDDEDATDLTFLIPHGATLVLGGTAEPDDERSEPDPATTAAIITRCARLDPRLADARILAERVGFRPERPEVRVAAERRSDTWVWHNYGHGGAGVTLSWGCAEEITASVLATLDGGSSTAVPATGPRRSVRLSDW
jgi:D-amino-acid oxidase